MTTFSFEENSVPVPVLIRVSGNAPAAPPPESTLPPPILLSSAVVPSVAQSGSDLLPAPGCVVAERVVGFGGPAGPCQCQWASGATISFSQAVSSSSSSSESERAAMFEGCPCARSRHLCRQMRRVVGLRGVILEGTLSDYQIGRAHV